MSALTKNPLLWIGNLSFPGTETEKCSSEELRVVEGGFCTYVIRIVHASRFNTLSQKLAFGKEGDHLDAIPQIAPPSIEVPALGESARASNHGYLRVQFVSTHLILLVAENHKVNSEA